MKILAAILFFSCLSLRAAQEVRFEFINISTNKIIVDSIVGLPSKAAPGVVVPTLENGPIEKSMVTFKETVPVEKTLKIIWEERGVKHEAEFDRDAWNLSAKIKSGMVQFLYHGNNGWQIGQFGEKELKRATAVSELPDVSFEWFNLSTNQIWVVEVVGLPPEASCGRLMPSKGENPLEGATSVFSETLDIKRKLTIVWKDAGTNGFQRLKPPALSPPGVEHRLELKRDDLGIPPRITNGKIRFTYLGNEQWRVRFFKGDQSER